MESALSSILLYVLAALVGGLIIGWLIRSIAARKQTATLESEWQAKTDTVSRHRDRLTAEINSMRTTVEAQEAVVHQRDMQVAKARTELNSALEKEKLLTKNIFTLKAEREEFKNKVVTFQNALHSLKAQSDELQVEFIKSGDFYKSELAKSFEKRKAVEEKYENAKKEYESFRNLLQASRSEHDSVNKMLESAKARLANLDALEQNVIALEAENAELKHNSALVRQENEALKRDVLELEELKVQNRELAQVLKSMENSRKQYEEDANRYREHAGKYEEKSETLRIRLDEVEQNFQEMEQQQRQALKDAREKANARQLNGSNNAAQEHDNLQEIVGIGKVFEHTLHSLGITSFRQIASFDVADIARVNAELKEFKGRMEQDDWIGQAKELHFKKYGAAS
tara:strand:- start:499 stop:1695 length:1197 start_codon:yes stop_codon:yes gene_type:complete